MGTCYKCPDRTVDCHTTCEDYLARWERDRTLDEQKRIESIADEINTRSYEKTRRRRRAQL